MKDLLEVATTDVVLFQRLGAERLEHFDVLAAALTGVFVGRHR
jgi:hypothetical protein